MILYILKSNVSQLLQCITMHYVDLTIFNQEFNQVLICLVFIFPTKETQCPLFPFGYLSNHTAGE